MGDNDAVLDASNSAVSELPVEEVEVMTSNKGRHKICYRGNMYTFQITRCQRMRWRCVKRTHGCKGTMTTDLELKHPQPGTEHNHAAADASVAAAKCITAMKRKAASTEDKPHQIYASTVMTLNAEDRAHLPSEDIIKRTLRNQRAKAHSAELATVYPAEPATLRDLQLDNKWSTTAGPNPQAFLFYDNGPDTDSRIIAFGTDEALTLLSSSQTWMMDGNFAMAPPGFLQFYVIRVPLGSTTVSAVYALLQHKTQDTYEELLRAVMDRCHQLNQYPDPRTVIIDSAVISAFKTGFGPDTQTQEGFYHLTQSTWRMIQNLGLTNKYKDDDHFRQFCGEIDALAFLPTADIPAGMQHLRDTCPADAIPLLDYFGSTYISGTYMPLQNMNPGTAALNLHSPKFPPELWNVHSATLSDDPRTNNQSEGWSNKFFHLGGYTHPSIWKLIKTLQKEEAAVSVMIARDAVGQPPQKRMKRIYVGRQQQLKNLCKDYIEDRTNLEQFLSNLFVII